MRHSTFTHDHAQSLLGILKQLEVIGHMHGTLGGEHERVTYGAVPLKLPPLVASQTLASNIN